MMGTASKNASHCFAHSDIPSTIKLLHVECSKNFGTIGTEKFPFITSVLTQNVGNNVKRGLFWKRRTEMLYQEQWRELLPPLEYLERHESNFLTLPAL